MEFYKFQGSKDSDSEHEPENLNLVDKFKESVNHFEDEISHSKTINSDSDSIQQLLHIFSEILEDGFERRDSGNNDPHYWFTVSSILDTIPMRFVNSLEKFTTDNEKAYVWILIELHKKNLLNILNDILKTPRIMQYYKERAIIRVNTQKIQDISSKLCRLDYTIESKFLKVYEENKNDFEDNSEDGSVVVRDNTALSQNENWADKLYHHSRISEGSNNSPGFSPEFKKTGNQQIDNTNNMTQSQPLPVIKPVKVDDVKQSLERYKNLLKRPTIIGREEEEQEVFVREGYKQELEEKNKFNPFMFVSKVIDPVNRFKNLLPAAQQKKVLRKTSSYEDLNRKSQWQDDNNTLKPNHDNYYNRKNTRKSSYEFKGPPKAHGFSGHATPMGGHTFYKPRGFNDEKASGTANFRQSEIRHMKNSQLLYLEKYQSLADQYEYRSPPERVITPEEQDYKCFGCGAGLSKIMIMIFPRRNYCQYTGYWYCNACMAKEKLLIPWKVRDQLDFKLQHVCRKAREEIKAFYDKPNILIESKSKVVVEDQVFYDTLVMRRQLHLIFDMICDTNIVLDVMGANANLLLKVNLFSLKNLSDIHNGAMQRYMDRCWNMLLGHIDHCTTCQSKGRICPSCHNTTKIFPFDIKNTSVCRNCKYLYHSRCLKLKKCIVCQHDS